jgi:hypothetical protein
MKDKWMNMGYEEEELKPYVEPEPDYKDVKRIGMLLNFFLQQMLTPKFWFSTCTSDLYWGGNSEVSVCMLWGHLAEWWYISTHS